MTLQPSAGENDESVALALRGLAHLVSEWNASEKPNTYIDHYDISKTSLAIKKIESLLVAAPSELVGLAQSILDDVSLPLLTSSNIEYAWLKSYWQLTRIQENLAIIAYSEEEVKSPFSTKDNVEAISEISRKIDSIKLEIDELRKERDPFGRVSISILGFSAPLNTIYKSVSKASQLLKSANLDTVSLTQNLEIAYQEAKSVWKKAVGLTQGLSKRAMDLFEGIVTNTNAILGRAFDMVVQTKKRDLTYVALKLENGSKEDVTRIFMEISNLRKKSLDEGFVVKSSLLKLADLFNEFSFFLSAASVKSGDKYALRLSPIQWFEDDQVRIKVHPAGVSGTETKDVAMKRLNYLESVFSFCELVHFSLEIEAPLNTALKISISRFDPVIFLEKRVVGFDEASVWS